MSTQAAQTTSASPSTTSETLKSAPTQATSTTTTSTATTSAAATSAAANNVSDWLSGANDDIKGWVSNKGFKSPIDAIESARNLEKLLGGPRERLMTIPERQYDDQGKMTQEARAFRERLGAPKEAKEYDLKMPAEGGDPQLMEHFKNVFHEAGVPKSDAEKIVASWNDYQSKSITAMKEAATARLADEKRTLSKEWGAALEQNTNIAKEAVRTMGLDSKVVDALANTLGHAETMKLFHKLGKATGEAPFVGGQRADTVAEPLAAKAQIKELIRDKAFGKLLAAGDKDAQAKWTRLHQQASPGEYLG